MSLQGAPSLNARSKSGNSNEDLATMNSLLDAPAPSKNNNTSIAADLGLEESGDNYRPDISASTASPTKSPLEEDSFDIDEMLPSSDKKKKSPTPTSSLAATTIGNSSSSSNSKSKSNSNTNGNIRSHFGSSVRNKIKRSRVGNPTR